MQQEADRYDRSYTLINESGKALTGCQGFFFYTFISIFFTLKRKEDSKKSSFFKNQYLKRCKL